MCTDGDDDGFVSTFFSSHNNTGRYLKYSREVSQSVWIIEGERKASVSVEELISSQLLPIIGPSGIPLSHSHSLIIPFFLRDASSSYQIINFKALDERTRMLGCWAMDGPLLSNS